MSSTTETRSVPTYQLFYSRPGSLTPPTTSLHLPTRPKHTHTPLSPPSSLSLPRGPSRTPSHPIVISPSFSSGTASATPDSIKPVSRQVVDAPPASAGGDAPSTTGPPTVLTSDSEGGHSIRCDATTPPTTLPSSSPPSTSRTNSKTRSKRATRPHRKLRTKPTPPELLGIDLEPSTSPTPNLLSQWKPHSPSRVLATPTPSSPTTNVAPVGGTIVQPGSTHAQRKSYTVQFRTHQNRVAEFNEAYDVPFSTLNTTICFMNPQEQRRLDKGRTPLERQISSERRRAVWGYLVRTVGPAEVRDEEVWSEVGGKLRGMVHSWDEEWQAGHRERFERKVGLAASQGGRDGSGGARRSSEDRLKVDGDAWGNEELDGEVARGGKGKKGVSLWEAPGWKRWPPVLSSSDSDSDESFP